MSYAINNVMKNTRVKLIAFSVILVFSMLTSVSAWAATAGATVSKAEVEPKPKTYPDGQTVTLNFAGAEKILYTINGKSVKISADGTAGDENTLSADGSKLELTVTATTTIKAVGVAMTTNAAGKEVVAKSSAFSGSYKIVLPAPTFGVKGGSYKAGQSVSLEVPQVDGTNVVTGDVAFFYTTDPKASVESFTSYGGPIAVAQNTTIRAYMAKGELKSKVVSAKYTINLPSPKIEQRSKTFTATAETNILLPDGYEGGDIYYTTNGSNPEAKETDDCKKYNDAIPIQSALMTLKAIYVKDGAISKPVSATYKINLAAPTFNQKAGTMTDNSKSIVIDAKVGNIYYTTDKTVSTAIPTLTNGAPAAPWTPYVQSLTLTENQTTIRAIAVSNGVASKVTSVGYTINLPIPVFTPKAGKIADATTVTIAKASSLSSEAKIYYTTTAVTTSTVALADVQKAPWIEYPPIGISIDSATTTIKAVVVKDNIVSKIASATYTMNLPTVKSSVSPKTYTTPQSVKLSAATGAAIKYTLDGSIPTKDGTNANTKDFTPDSPAIQINSSTVIKAIAVKNNVASATATFAYTINLPAITFNPAGGFVAPNSKISITNTSFPKGTVIYYTTGSTPDGTVSPIDANLVADGNSKIYDSTVGIVPTGNAGDPYVVKAVAVLADATATATYSKITTGTFKIENAQTLTIDMIARTVSAPAAAPFTGAPTTFKITANSTDTAMNLNADYLYDSATKKITLTNAGFMKFAANGAGDVISSIVSGGRSYAGTVVIADAVLTSIYNPGTTAVTSITVTGANDIAAGSKFWIVDTVANVPVTAVLGSSTSKAATTTLTIPSTLFSGSVSVYNVAANKIFKSPTPVSVVAFDVLDVDMTAQTITLTGVKAGLISLTIDGTAMVKDTDFTYDSTNTANSVITLNKNGIVKLAAMSSGNKTITAVYDNGMTRIGALIISDPQAGIVLQNPGTAATDEMLLTGNTTVGAKYIILNNKISGILMGTASETKIDFGGNNTFGAGELSAYYVTANTLHKPLKVTVATNPYAETTINNTVVGLQVPVTGVSVQTAVYATGTTPSPEIKWAMGAATFKPSLTMKNTDSTVTIGVDGSDKWVWTKGTDSTSAPIIKEITADGVITMNDTNAIATKTATVIATLKDSTGNKTRLNKENAEIKTTITITVVTKANSAISAATVNLQTVLATNTFGQGTGSNDGSTIDKSIELVVAGTASVYNTNIEVTRQHVDATVKYYVGSHPSSDADFNGTIATVATGTNPGDLIVSGKIATTLNLNDSIYLLVQNKTGKTYYKIAYKLPPTAATVSPVSSNANGDYTVAGKTITIKFNQPIKADLNIAKLTLTSTAGTSTAKVEPATGYADTFVITLGADPTIAADSQFTIAKEDIKTADGLIALDDVTFRVPNPPTAKATEAVTTTNADGMYVATNTITLKFNTPVDASKVTLANLGITGTGNPTFGGNGAAITPTTGFHDTYEITLGADPTIHGGDVITIAAANAVNQYGITAFAPVKFSVLYKAKPAKDTVTKTVAGSAYAKNDTITVTFTQPVDVTKLADGSKFVIDGGHKWQASGEATVTPVTPVGGYAKSFKITLGASTTVEGGEKVTIAQNDIVNPDGDKLAASAGLTFTIPCIGTPAAGTITTDAKGDTGYVANKKITISFTHPVLVSNITTIANLGLSRQPSGSPAWHDTNETTIGATAPVDGYAKTFVITLGAGVDVVAGDKITIDKANVVNTDGTTAANPVVFTVPVPTPVAITLAPATPDGATTTKITLDFGVDLNNEDGFDVVLNDIGETEVTLGSITKVGGQTGKYDLAIGTPPSKSGDISITVTKPGYTITGATQTVAIVKAS